MNSLPAGAICTQTWLYKLGIDRNLAERYCSSGWLVRIGAGAYKRPFDEVKWSGCFHSLINQLHYKMHLSGLSALELNNYRQHLNLGNKNQIWITKDQNEKRNLPKWVFNYLEKKHEIIYFARNLFQPSSNLGIYLKNIEGFELPISTPERAILEFLDLIPQSYSVEQAHFILESMVTLNSKLIQTLLSHCISRKVKRLFMLLAEHENHEWFKYVNKDEIYLGEGKLKIGQGGFYYPKYQISLPINLKTYEGM
ncbi:hypothetical protein A8135_02035 [Legionella jamestowniensis]|uniref:Transcriptional regulator AbiEi antitoxin N-terminal domain-containing protein n=2 Tax=Legionella jamestowniensis TaxID=455 RepID=A0ABX2XU74_9GAMM|nr:hypothetical protein A8135_02035 [Legionella jamestowniensis]